MSWQDGNRKLVRQLLEEAARRVPAADAAQIAAFIEQYYDHFPLEELRGRSLSDLYASTYGSWRFLQYYDRSRPKVRVLNPEFERHGWQLSHTVVAIICRDMPFALDSVRAELNSRNITIYTIHSSALRTRRGSDGMLQALLPDTTTEGEGIAGEALLYLEIDRHSDAAALADIERTLDEILREVALVVDDFPAMLARVDEAHAALDGAAAEPGEVVEVQAFLDWLRQNFFTFLAYEYLQVDSDGNGGYSGDVMVAVEQARLGLLRLPAYSASDSRVADDGPVAERRRRSLISFTKAAVRSRVHRRSHPDFIAIRVVTGDGRLIGEHRFLGMYTSRAYTMPPGDIPVVRCKLVEVMARAGYPEGSHEAAELLRVLEIHPRDELFYAAADQLYEIAIGINRIQERRLVRLFPRRDARSDFVSCLVFMPRDLYRTELRRKVQALLCEAYGADEAEFTTFFSESILTRTHFVLHVDRSSQRDVDAAELEREIVRISMSWPTE